MSSSIQNRHCNRPETSNELVFPENKRSSDLIRILSYNIRSESTLDRNHGNSWGTRQHKIQYLIQRYQPDIIGLQEVIPTYVPDLLNLFPEYTCVAYITSTDNVDLALLIRKNRFIIEEEHYFWLSEDPYVKEIPSQGFWDARKPRRVLHATLHDQHTNKKCVFFCTHFDSTGVESRLKSAQILIDKQKEIAPNLPIVIVGDLNLSLTHPTLPTILKTTEETYSLFTKDTGLNDIRDFAQCPHYGPDGSWIGWKYDKYASPTNTVGERLDHIFVAKCNVIQEGVLKVKVNNTLDSFVLPSEKDYNNLPYPSDHLPIIADIYIL